jgi:ribosomal-protein-alanine N-acetyltransferase
MKRYRINEQQPLKTKRLLLTPMNEAELSEYLEHTADGFTRSAFAEMRRCVVGYPDQALWYTSWRVSLRGTGEPVGYLGFHGMPEDKTVRLGFEVLEQHRGNGYAGEAVKALCDWAFSRENAYFIQVMADESNAAANHVLEVLKFYRIESPIEGQCFWELERPASAWMAVYLSLGLCLGLALGGSVFDSQTLGISIGMCTGLALGLTMDSQDRTARKREKEPKKLDAQEKEKK